MDRSKLIAHVASVTGLPLPAETPVTDLYVTSVSLVPLGHVGVAAVYKDGDSYRVVGIPFSLMLQHPIEEQKAA